ncbi:hypothetical protein CYLTODRAFT_440109 [Cylindrobasidium torrendii FP15055 ss-10]|uniref:Uncharacterized protein n=1 Tax=Cylindrobasidium torrendii FP15055 ss-10 TaxID=1314674 RepID=A0A0D7BS67_9AGAR|nr:hypothetical protein CYLTODRAFT_440109 [Cylindrobasidium torrendii FP15055 ss-10]
MSAHMRRDTGDSESYALMDQGSMKSGKGEDTFLEHSAESRRSTSTPGALRDSVVLGWDWALVVLLLHSLVDFCWGVALLVFSLGVVPISWWLSQKGRAHIAETNTLVTLVSTLSTTHLKLTLDATLLQIARLRAATGFTLGEWQWMQDTRMWAVWPEFGRHRRLRTWLYHGGWLVFWLGVQLHSASITAIMQPVPYFVKSPHPNGVPCPVDTSSVSFDASPYLSSDAQETMDFASRSVGASLASQYFRFTANDSLVAPGRVYVKDSIGYGVSGHYWQFENNGLTTPGVEFITDCDTTGTRHEALWKSVFPDRAVPTINQSQNGTNHFVAQSLAVNETDTMREVRNRNLSDNAPAYLVDASMYALVTATGSGVLFLSTVVSAGRYEWVCAWKTEPRSVTVHLINWVARAENVTDALQMPATIGRAVQQTLTGISVAVDMGATFNPYVNPAWVSSLMDNGDMLHFGDGSLPYSDNAFMGSLLADGVKSGLTAFYQLYDSSAQWDCHDDAHVKAMHWKFGNSNGLGWIAIIWTVVAGFCGLAAAWMLFKRPRIGGVEPLKITDTFAMGRHAVVEREAQVTLVVRNGVVQPRY